MAKQLKSYRSILRAVFQEAIERGDLPEERDPQVLATTMLTYAQGLILMNQSGIEREMIDGAAEVMKRSLKQ